MSIAEVRKFEELKTNLHQIYEYKKGVRNLILCTINRSCADILSKRLENQGIDYHIQDVANEKVNLFFGKKPCLNALKNFITSKPLNQLTPEEDFMLGIMLGYDISKQSERYCMKRDKL